VKPPKKEVTCFQEDVNEVCNRMAIRHVSLRRVTPRIRAQHSHRHDTESVRCVVASAHVRFYPEGTGLARLNDPHWMRRATRFFHACAQARV